MPKGPTVPPLLSYGERYRFVLVIGVELAGFVTTNLRFQFVNVQVPWKACPASFVLMAMPNGRLGAVTATKVCWVPVPAC